MARNRGIKYFYKLKMYELAEKLDVSLPESRKKKEPRKKEEPRKKKGSPKRQSVKVFNRDLTIYRTATRRQRLKTKSKLKRNE